MGCALEVGKACAATLAAPARLPRGGRRARRAVRSITVEGVPGSSPPSTTAAAAVADLRGDVLDPPRIGSAGRFALVATSAPSAVEHLAAGPASRDADADRIRTRRVEPGEPPRRVRQHERQRPGSSARAIARARAGSSGTRSSSTSTEAKRSAVGWIASAPWPRRARARRPRCRRRPPARRPCRSGSPRARPPRSASIAASTALTGAPRRRARDRRGRRVTRTSRYPSGQQRRDVVRLAVAVLEHERAAGGEHARRPARRPRRPRAERAPPRAPSRAPRARASRSFVGSTYGGFDTTRSHGRRGARRTGRGARARRRARCARRSRARARAPPRRRRSPVTRAPGCSSAIASAIAPQPVPTSSTRGASSPSSSARHRSTTTSVSGRGMSARRSTVSVSRRNPHSPSTYWSGSRAARRATSSRTPSSSRAVERPVEVHVELDPLHPERVREQQLRVEPRRLRSRRARCSAASAAAPRRGRAAASAHRSCRVNASRRRLTTAAASSARRRSSAWSASVNSWRSPSRIWSSRCTVSLTRWSVSRFSGKL